VKPTIEEKSEDSILLEKFDERKWSELTRAEQAQLGSLTKRMYEESPDDLAAKSRYADLLIASRDFRTALTILRDLANDDPLQRGLQAAAMARRLNRHEEANAINERSLKLLSTKSDQDPTNLSVSLGIAQHQLFLKRFEPAIRTLDKARKLAKSPRDQQLASWEFRDATVAYIRHIEGTSNGTVTERIRILELLQLAVKSSQRNPRVLNTISQQLLRADNEKITELLGELRTALDEAKVNAIEKASNEK